MRLDIVHIIIFNLILLNSVDSLLNNFYDYITLLLSALCLISIAFLLGQDGFFSKLLIPKFFAVLSLFAASILLSVIINERVSSNFNETIVIIFKALFPIIIMAYAYLLTLRFEPERLSKYALFFVMPLPFFAYFLPAGVISEQSDILQTNWSNIAITILPIVLLLRRAHLRFLAISIILVVIAISLKRSAVFFLLILFAISLFYAIANFRPKIRKKSFIRLMSGLLLSLFGFFVFIRTEYFDSILSRLTGIQDDKGSGRLDIWYEAFMIWRSANFENYVFGFGPGAYQMITETNVVSSHNDILDILANYGLFGFLSICIFYLYFFRRSIYSLKNPLLSDYHFFILAALSGVIVFTMVSGVFHFSKMFSLLFFNIGMVIAISTQRGQKN